MPDTEVVDSGASFAQRPRTLLLVDDEPNILAALQRLLRREGYTIFTAESGAEGLALLAQHPVDVIVSDQRMPGMTGVEFLRQAKVAQPETMRLVLSGYTELKSVTDAINEGAIYKFLTKPWDDAQLCANIAEAFVHKGLEDDNRRLGEALQRANDDLEHANRRLRDLLAEKEREIVIDKTALDIAREVLCAVPTPIIGVDVEGMIVLANACADELFSEGQTVLCTLAGDCLPEPLKELVRSAGEGAVRVVLAGTAYRAVCRDMGAHSPSSGRLLILMPDGSDHDQ